MFEQTLTNTPPLAGFDKQNTTVSLSEITNYALVSMAIPLGGGTVLQNEMAVKFGANFPECGKSTVSTDGSTRFLGMQ